MRWAWRWPSGCSPPASDARDRRPPHVRDRERRRHAGGRGLGGLLARRPPRPGPADRLLRRQQDPARRRDEDGFSEDVGKRYEAYGWHVQNVGEDIELDSRGRDRGGARRGGPALAGDPAHPHRLRLAQQAGHPEGARLAARRGRGAATKEAYGWDPDAHFLVPDEVREHFREVAERGREAEAEWDERPRGLPARAPSSPSSSCSWTGGCRTAGTRTCRASARTTTSPPARRRAR